MSDAVLARERAHSTVPEPAPRPTPVPAYGAALSNIAVALPETRVSNVVVAERAGVDPAWIVSRTGIEERRHAAPGETLVDLAARAGASALAQAQVDALDVDLLLVATATPDAVLPATAPLVAHALGATRAGALELGAACTGFISGLSVAAAAVESGRAETVLVIGAEILSRYVDPSDRGTAPIFGDGAGAGLVTRTDGPGRIGPVVLGADGAGGPSLCASRERGVIEMDGPEVFRHAIARMGEATLAACERAGVELADVDLFVYHQANARILRSLTQRLGLDPEKVVDCIGPHGNTSAASIPIALDAARRDGRLIDGATVLVSAFGAGFTWGGVILEW